MSRRILKQPIRGPLYLRHTNHLTMVGIDVLLVPLYRVLHLFEEQVITDCEPTAYLFGVGLLQQQAIEAKVCFWRRLYRILNQGQRFLRDRNIGKTAPIARERLAAEQLVEFPYQSLEKLRGRRFGTVVPLQRLAH